MARMLPNRTSARPLSIRALPGETEGTKGARPDVLQAYGRLCARARELLGLTQQELAFQLEHRDHTRVSKWEAGLENPQMAKLFAIQGYRGAFIEAIAEGAAQDFEIETVIRRRRA